MPIYAYKCESCGHRQDVLQKMSDQLLTVCPSCGAAAYTKQVTAAGFQLKGSGWYVTDFRGGNTAAKPAEADVPADKAAVDATKAPAEAAAGKSAEPAAAAAPAASPAPAPSPAPAASPAPKGEAGKPSSSGS